MGLNAKIDNYRHLPRFENEYLSRAYLVLAISIAIGGWSYGTFNVLKLIITSPRPDILIFAPIALFVLLGLIMMAKVYFFTCFHVFIDGSVIIGLNIFGWEKRFDLSDLREITVSKLSKYQIIFKYRKSGKMQMSANISDCGKLMEFILSKAINLESLNIDKLPTLESKFGLMWKKQPNWVIINEAKRRTVENRKKIQQLPIETTKEPR